jgi:UDP-N-acetylglucosamine--N-acetylmuramyl-(pentapeptide) pyrophosphoryl-undecaprenol N-acetylglucosamine transferase
MNSLSELAALSKPSIIIPLAGSTNNHQFKNANYLAKQGAVRVLLQSDLEGKRLVNEISKLASDHEAMGYLSTSIHKFFKPNSSSAIAELILSLGINRNKKEA